MYIGPLAVLGTPHVAPHCFSSLLHDFSTTMLPFRPRLPDIQVVCEGWSHSNLPNRARAAVLEEVTRGVSGWTSMPPRQTRYDGAR